MIHITTKIQYFPINHKVINHTNHNQKHPLTHKTNHCFHIFMWVPTIDAVAADSGGVPAVADGDGGGWFLQPIFKEPNRKEN